MEQGSKFLWHGRPAERSSSVAAASPGVWVDSILSKQQSNNVRQTPLASFHERCFVVDAVGDIQAGAMGQQHLFDELQSVVRHCLVQGGVAEPVQFIDTEPTPTMSSHQQHSHGDVSVSRRNMQQGFPRGGRRRTGWQALVLEQQRDHICRSALHRQGQGGVSGGTNPLHIAVPGL